MDLVTLAFEVRETRHCRLRGIVNCFIMGLTAPEIFCGGFFIQVFII